jgi:hypothetical protein
VFIFSRQAKSQQEKIELGLDDFNSEEIEELFIPVAIDPGRKNACTGSYDYGSVSHMIHNLSTKEYYNMTGSKKAADELQVLKDRAGITLIESNVPTAKTCKVSAYLSHVRHVVQHLATFFSFYNEDDGERKFLAYRNTQRARAEAVNMFVNGGKKYNRHKRRKTRRNRKRRKQKRKRKLRYDFYCTTKYSFFCLAACYSLL